MIDYNRIISEIEDDKAFVLLDNTRIRTLQKLSDIIPTLPDSSFYEHVNDSKNDFSSWIKYCFNDEFLADKILKLKTKNEMVDAIKTRIDQAKQALRLKESQVIPPVKETIQTKEILQTKEIPQIKEIQKASDEKTEFIIPTIIETTSPEINATIPPVKIQSNNLQADTIQLNTIKVDNNATNNVSDNNQLEAKQNFSLEAKTENETGLDLDADLDLNLDPNLDNYLESSTKNKDNAPLDSSLDNTPDINLDSDLDLNLDSSLDTSLDNQPVMPQLEVTQSSTNLSSSNNTINSDINKIKDDVAQNSKKDILEKLANVNSIPTLEDLKPQLQTVKEQVSKQESTVEPVEELKLTDEEKFLLISENKDLTPTQIFKKFKLQKTMSAKQNAQVQSIAKEVKAEVPSGLFDSVINEFNASESDIVSDSEINKIKSFEPNIPDIFTNQKIKEVKHNEPLPPKDLLNISDEEFQTLLGVDFSEEFIATTAELAIVKSKSRRHLKTGVEGFDDLIDKGILEGSSVLVSGGPGSGKTTFCMQQLGWAAEHGEKCLFISLEEKEENLIDHMKGYGLNPEKYIKDETLKIKKLDSFKLSRAVEALLAHARGELMIDITPVLDIIPDNYKPERVVLDSLSSIAAAFAGRPEEYRIYVEQLFNIFGGLGVTSFIITEIQGNEPSGHGGVEDFLADGVINFYSLKKGTVRQPAVEVLKMRGVNHKKKIVPFGFISGKGIEVYPLEEVFHGN